MPRRLRILVPGLIHHVMARGNGKMAIFLDAADYRRFVYLLGDVVERFGIRCWNYCVMPNHYHLTLQPSAANLSCAVQRLNGLYAQWWTRRYGRPGHVFQGRFKDQLVQQERYLLELSRYVVNNPVRAGLVARPEEWTWSSYRATSGQSEAPAFLATGLTLSLFGTGDDGALRRLFVEHMRTDPDDESVIDRIRSNERIVGTREFKLAVETTPGAGVQPGSGPPHRQRPGQPRRPDELVIAGPQA